MKRSGVLYLSRDTPGVLYFSYSTSIGSALIVILYFLVVLFGAALFSTRIAGIFAHQDVSECL